MTFKCIAYYIYHNNYIISRPAIIPPVKYHNFLCIAHIVHTYMITDQSFCVAISVPVQSNQIVIQLKDAAVGILFSPFYGILVVKPVIFETFLTLKDQR